MLKTPLVTVICTCYNHEKYVVESLNSVISQSYQNIQLIIADDYSTDDSCKTIKKWIKNHPDVLFLENPKNIGNIKTFNNAYKHAKGLYIIDLAADDILLKHCIEVQVTTFLKTRYKKLGIVYANINLVDANKKHLSIYYDENDAPESGNIYKMVIGRKTMICSVASMIKKQVFDDIGNYDENLYYEDLDLWVRASRVFDFEYIPSVLAEKRELSTSLSAHFLYQNSSKTKKLHNSTLKIFEKILALNTSKDEYRIMLNRIYFEIFKFLKTKEFILLLKLLRTGFKAFIKSI